MGVPKFFRWLSERYPKINQPFTSPPSPETVAAHFPDGSDLPPSVKSSDRAKKSTSSAGGSDGDAAAFSSSAPKASDAVEADLEHEHHLKCNLRPEFDRLYIDMNGVIHCCSHNNATDDDPSIDPEIHLDAAERSAASPATPPPGSVSITEEQIFHNVCYYLDRIVTDVAQPQELVYLAIDGVAPRAKMNQQRSRRYRSGKEREIEATFYEAHLASAAESSATSTAAASEIVFRGFDGDGHEDEEEDNGGFAYADRTGAHIAGVSDVAAKDVEALAASGQHGHDNIREVTPGRFSGTFQTTEDRLHTDDELARKCDGVDGKLPVTDASDVDVPVGTAFHSNTITPGTPFFDRCTAHIKDFVRRKLREDPRWANLTIIFSGPDVPGEGEHKIMDFIRRERARADYNPNTRHCLFGQDGDLIMLGLATHEPNFCLLREEVIFDEGRKAAALAKHRRSSTEADGSNGGSNLSASLDAYMHNANFELLHMSLLRDYLAYEFETSDVVPSSPFDIESTIDDFVFMTFFVGNDFLPHMPALDIGDEAFDLLFYTYKRHRYGWLASEMEKNDVRQDKSTPYPYLTRGGNIVSGSRLEEFLSEVGSHEDPYYSNKNRKKEKELKRIRKFDEKAGREPSIPSDEALWNREEKDRERYMEMLQNIDGNLDDVNEDGAFSPVISSGQLPASSREVPVKEKDGVFRPEENELQVGFLDNMSRLLKNSLSSQGIAEVGGTPGNKANTSATVSQQKEDASASAAALEGQLTDLKGRYYYDKFGFTPVDAEKHRSLRKAYIEGLVWNLEYYYKGCTSWEWYYPYHYGPMLSDLVNIDSFLEDISFDDKLGEPLRPYEQLLGCLPPSSSDLLPEPYQWLMTSRKSPIIDFYPESFTVDMNGKRWPWEAVVLLPWIDSERLLDASRNLISDDMLTEEERKRNEFGTASFFKGEEETVFEEDAWTGALTKEPVFRPEILDGTVHPLPGFPTLKDAPVQGLLRRRVGVNVFGMRSRYRTAILQMDSDLPEVPPASVLGPKFVGTTIFFRYPHLQEGFVTAVSDDKTTIRGNTPLRRWTKEEADLWQTRNAALNKKAMTGEGLTGTGGWLIPRSSVTLCVRPLKGIETMTDGSKVKVYAKAEIEIPLATALWNPSRVDSRYASLPARLEKNPYKYVSVEDKESTQILGRKSKRKGKGQKKSIKVPALPSFSSAKDTAPLRDEDLLPPLPIGTKDSGGPSVSILPPLEYAKDGAAALVSSSSRRGYSTLVRSGSAMVSRKERSVAGELSQHGFTSASATRRGFATSTEAHSLRGTAVRSASSIRTGGGVRGKATMALAMATAALFLPGSHARGDDLWSSRVSINPVRRLAASRFPGTTNPRLFGAIMTKGGGTMLQDDVGVDDTTHMDPPTPTTPPLEHAHGTTTLSFKFKDGIVAAVDSRASIGNFVGSKTTQKVLPVSKNILGTMAGGAADCSFWIRKLRREARNFELTMNRGISVARAAKILSQALYANRGLGLSVGTMIMGYDAHGPSIYYVDNSGTCLEGDVFSVGSGSTYALGILDAAPASKSDMSEEEAVALGIKAIRHATYRDAYSGGYIGVYVITKGGWRKVFSEDLALSGDSTGNGGLQQ